MSIYLSTALAGHRKGRFLHRVAGAIPLESYWLKALPSAGLFIVEAAELADQEALQGLHDWAMQPGCAALVVNPPSQFCQLTQPSLSLDWSFEPVVSAQDSKGEGITAILATEIHQKVIGFAGSADSQLHTVGALVHTRYVRKHGNSGLFAVTTLPLWSLSLMDHAADLISWLHWFIDHAGVARVQRKEEHSIEYVPDQHDMVILLLLFAGHGKTIKALVEQDAVKLMFDVESLHALRRSELLQKHGFIHETGLTELGRDCLQASPFWGYASLLSEQIKFE
ncbi:MAG: hypothetical protein VX185_16700 [Pseudomonadota bacterium]|nr:hypothetical protein [Pseudomonadota bacterium]